MKKEIFREYDIRGILDRDFNLSDVERMGHGYGTYLIQNGGKTAVIARDCRLSSPSIRDALVTGLMKTGIHVKGSNLLLALVISKQILYKSAYVTSIKNRISRCLVSYNEQG
jgi:phosphomannomutase